MNDEQISNALEVQNFALTDKVRQKEKKGTTGSLLLMAGLLFVLWVFAGGFTLLMIQYSAFGMCVGGVAFLGLTIFGPIFLIQNIRKTMSQPGKESAEKVAKAFYEDFSPADTFMKPSRHITLTRMIAPAVVNNFEQDIFSKIDKEWSRVTDELKQQMLAECENEIKTGFLNNEPVLADDDSQFEILVIPEPLRDNVATIKCRRLYKLFQKQSGILQDKNVELGSAEVTYSNVAVCIQNRWFLVSPEPGELSQ